MKKTFLLAIVMVSYLATPAAAADYIIDKDQTNIGFSVKHMLISNVKGRFRNFSGSFSFDEKTKLFSRAELTVNADSIDTEVTNRDRHLRSSDFLDVEKCPKITFNLKNSEVLDDGTLRVTGDLTIHCITREIMLQGEFLGAAKTPMGVKVAGFTATGRINRGDFGLKWNQALELGGVLVGEEVKFQIEVEGIQKP